MDSLSRLSDICRQRIVNWNVGCNETTQNKETKYEKYGRNIMTQEEGMEMTNNLIGLPEGKNRENMRKVIFK